MTATWSIANHAGCCGFDVDALIDDETGEIIVTRCNICGEEKPFLNPDWDESD